MQPRLLTGFVRVIVFAPLVLGLGAPAQDGSSGPSLAEMKAKYRQAMEAAGKELEQEIAEAVKKAAAESDLDTVAALAKEREAFLKTGDPPGSEAVADASAAYQEKTERYHRVMLDLYQQAIKDRTRKLQIEEATRLEEEMKAFQATRRLDLQPEAGAANPDLAEAQVRNRSEFEAARTKWLDALDARLRQAAAQGDLAKAKEIQSLQKEFQERGVVSEVGDAALRRTYAQYLSELDRSTKKLEAAYTKAIQDHARRGEKEQAAALQAELIQGVGLAPKKWTVIFRSSDPTLWNARQNDERGYAVPLEEAPDDVRHLRLRRMDTGELVIVPISREQLGKNYVQGAIGWGGAKDVVANYHRLGVYRTDVRNEFKGMVTIGRDGFTPFTGWGFGTRTNVDDRQAYAWSGREIPPTVFEIAVTADPLAPEESRFLLAK